MILREQYVYLTENLTFRESNATDRQRSMMGSVFLAESLTHSGCCDAGLHRSVALDTTQTNSKPNNVKVDEGQVHICASPLEGRSRSSDFLVRTSQSMSSCML